MICVLWVIVALLIGVSIAIAALALIAYANWNDEEDDDEFLGAEAGRLEVSDGDA